jgi:hypothetical protein
LLFEARELTETKTKTLIITALILATVLVCSFVTVMWWQSIGGLECLGSNSEWAFICQPHSSHPFTVTTTADLTDGMNRNEAIAVAQIVFAHEMHNAAFTVKAAEPSADGVWTVNLSWGAIVNGQQEALSHYFDVTVNPTNQTASYSRCY